MNEYCVIDFSLQKYCIKIKIVFIHRFIFISIIFDNFKQVNLLVTMKMSILIKWQSLNVLDQDKVEV